MPPRQTESRLPISYYICRLFRSDKTSVPNDNCVRHEHFCSFCVKKHICCRLRLGCASHTSGFWFLITYKVYFLYLSGLPTPAGAQILITKFTKALKLLRGKKPHSTCPQCSRHVASNENHTTLECQMNLSTTQTKCKHGYAVRLTTGA